MQCLYILVKADSRSREGEVVEGSPSAMDITSTQRVVSETVAAETGTQPDSAKDQVQGGTWEDEICETEAGTATEPTAAEPTAPEPLNANASGSGSVSGSGSGSNNESATASGKSSFETTATDATAATHSSETSQQTTVSKATDTASSDVTQAEVIGTDLSAAGGSLSVEIDESAETRFEREAVEKLLKKGLKEPDPRPHLNVVFIGHVDAGKSTTCGNILFTTGQVDARTIEKYEREAKEKNREGWYYAYVMDVNEEERAKGKTVEVGRASFELPSVRYTILDAPGHKGFVPEMLSGAAQADVAVLLVSARKGEFEAGFERGGQTREHALLAKTLGVNYMIVAINKMDESTVQWNQTRYDDICTKLSPFLKSSGFASSNIKYVPISGLSGSNILHHVSDKKPRNTAGLTDKTENTAGGDAGGEASGSTAWYESQASWYGTEKPTLFEILEGIEAGERNADGPLRIPVLSGYRDSGVMAVGKVNSGVAMVDQPAMLMPSKIRVKIVGIKSGETDYAYAKPGENVELRLVGVEEAEIKKGCVISSIKEGVPVTKKIQVQLVVLETLEHKPVITAGYTCMFHAHTLTEECEINKIISTKDKGSGEKKAVFAKVGHTVVCNLKLSQTIAIEKFSSMPSLGRFTLRDEGRTIAIGKVMGIVPA